MGKKIAQVDNDAMNSLFGIELSRMAGKKIAGADWQDDKGAPRDPQAFEDHAAYLASLKSALADDRTQDGDPNAELVD